MTRNRRPIIQAGQLPRIHMSAKCSQRGQAAILPIIALSFLTRLQPTAPAQRTSPWRERRSSWFCEAILFSP
jgi:hypothetical protein